MQFNEHQARMLAEQRQREAEMKQRMYELEMKQGKHSQSPDGDGSFGFESDDGKIRHYKRPEKQEQKKAPKKKGGRWWRFFLGG